MIRKPSRRQLEVLRYTADGLSTKATAAAMGLAYDTVKGHKQDLLNKLGASNCAQAVAVAVRAGML